MRIVGLVLVEYPSSLTVHRFQLCFYTGCLVWLVASVTDDVQVPALLNVLGYLGVGILPFNLLRCFIVSAVTYFLYPRLKRPLKLETREVYEDKYTPCENKDGESADEEKTVVVTEEKDGVFTAVNSENADEISRNDDNGALNDDKDLANGDKK